MLIEREEQIKILSLQAKNNNGVIGGHSSEEVETLRERIVEKEEIIKNLEC